MKLQKKALTCDKLPPMIQNSRRNLLFLFLIPLMFIGICVNSHVIEHINAITTASSLRCREEPNTNSKIIQKFPFATLIRLELKSKIKELTKESWIKVQNQNCFVSVEHLIFDQTNKNDLIKLVPEEYKCAPTESIKELPYYLIGDLYIHLVHEPMGNEYSPSNLLIEIGYLHFDKAEISMSNKKTGIFNPIGEWKGESKKKNVFGLVESYENNLSYYKSKNSEYTKTEAFKRCKELENKPSSLNNLKNVPWETYYNPIKISLEDIQIEMDHYRNPKESDKIRYHEYLKTSK
ncbi:SH3 domain-containing protein [Leptospira noumeaensis]|uniref:SH3 domain-containing protein n=1 Tax=Leptospira noumeaensis TaxID=2484964 RepID=A0A4R9IGH8_9LEPT|nr:SH3 domain-containing protein [Leptospira noumeaensis]TGK87517.1 SH3 domain-containing protein [Leptospira noumeaensis]